VYSSTRGILISREEAVVNNNMVNVAPGYYPTRMEKWLDDTVMHLKKDPGDLQTVDLYIEFHSSLVESVIKDFRLFSEKTKLGLNCMEEYFPEMKKLRETNGNIYYYVRLFNALVGVKMCDYWEQLGKTMAMDLLKTYEEMPLGKEEMFDLFDQVKVEYNIDWNPKFLVEFYKNKFIFENTVHVPKSAETE
jgi:hypothetical protein